MRLDERGISQWCAQHDDSSVPLAGLSLLNNAKLGPLDQQLAPAAPIRRIPLA